VSQTNKNTIEESVFPLATQQKLQVILVLSLKRQKHSAPHFIKTKTHRELTFMSMSEGFASIDKKFVP